MAWGPCFEAVASLGQDFCSMGRAGQDRLMVGSSYVGTGCCAANWCSLRLPVRWHFWPGHCVEPADAKLDLTCFDLQLCLGLFGLLLDLDYHLDSAPRPDPGSAPPPHSLYVSTPSIAADAT